MFQYPFLTYGEIAKMLSDQEVQGLHTCFPFLKEINSGNREGIAKFGNSLTIPENSIVFGVGSPCETFFFLTSGGVKVSIGSDEGREISLYRVAAGESCILTTCCVLGGACYPARGVTDSPSAGVSVPGHVVLELVADSLSFRKFLFSTYADRIVNLMALVHEVTFKRLDKRLAAQLLEFEGETPITHQFLADQLGSVREVVSRILKSFEAQAIIRLGRQRIEILDRSALEKYTLP